MAPGDDDDTPIAHALRQVLSQAAQQCRVYLMHGNRDFLIKQPFADATGVALIEDPHVLQPDTLLTHGDSLCIDDVPYQQIRAVLQGQAWQTEILEKPLSERQAIGKAMREQSNASNANKASEIMDINTDALQQLMQANNSSLIIHGHTHRPGLYDSDKGEVNRVVLGDWMRCGWLCRKDDANVRLECFSLARRYGT